MALQVIGAGFGRTGTESTKTALEKLLGGKCYHMTEVFAHSDQLKRWEAFGLAGRKDMDWDALMANYVACVDWPVCNYYKELMAAYPDAKVVLNVRDPDKWFDSFQMLVRINRLFNRFAWLVPSYRRFRNMTETAVWHIFKDRTDRAQCIEVFKRHIAEVKATVPPEKLLVFRVQDGWQPLCDFLGLPVPEGPFLHTNQRGDTESYARRAVSIRVIKSLLLVLAVILLVGLVAGLLG